MITKIQLQKDAKVLAANGKLIGSLERVVVNSANNVITNIVVRTGRFLKQKEKVVPVRLVAETTQDKIPLRDDAGELKAFPPFEEEHIVNESGTSSSAEDESPMIVGNLGMGTPIVQSSGGRIVTRFEQNIPEGTVAMKEGAKVITTEGKNVGSVERVLADPSFDQVTHLLVSRGLFTKEAKLIPINWVMRMGEDRVHLRVSKDSVDELAETPIAV
jgi:uncharacterized protein YrrD